jgi:HemK-like putative methylase
MIYARQDTTLSMLQHRFATPQLACTFRCLCRGDLTNITIPHCTIHVHAVYPTVNAGDFSEVDVMPDASLVKDVSTIGVTKPLRRILSDHGYPVIGEGAFATKMGGHAFHGTFMTLVRVVCVHPVTCQVMEWTVEKPSKFHTFVAREHKFVQRDANVVKETGVVTFGEHVFRVTEDTLVPRPSSLTLVQAAVTFLTPHGRILDAGTGCGCLLVSILLQHSDATGCGIDLSPQALYVAQDNAARLGVANRAQFHILDMYALHLLSESYDLIVCNPPYLSHKKATEYFYNLREPELALVGGKQGHESYIQLEASIRTSSVLRPGGHLVLEVGNGKQQAVHNVFHDWQHVTTLQDDHGMDRCFVFRR